MRSSECAVGLLLVGVFALLPFAGHWLRDGTPPVCANSGAPIDPMYRVRIVGGGRTAEFCCIECAEHWLQKKKIEPEAIYVTDELSGEEVEAKAAYYVRNLVVTNRMTGNRIHVFRDKEQAEIHARSPGSYLLEDADRPFVRSGCCDCPECSREK